jgi:hypothetical protein
MIGMKQSVPRQAGLLSFSGVVPGLAVKAELLPTRSECGVGALMPWADRLWMTTYVSHRARTGRNYSLYEIDGQLRMKRRAESVAGTYANRMVHYPSQQLFIGPHVIDARRKVRTIRQLVDVRLAATAEHLSEPERKVYMLGMEGEFFEVDARSLAVKLLFDLTDVLDTPGEGRVHFKDAHTGFGRVVVADNTYDEKDFRGEAADGRLAEWDGREWRILERKPFVCVHSRGGFGGTMFAMGWDRASAILKVFTRADQTWRTWRLPKASHTFDHMWQTEWPRIREVEHERFLMDCHGMFYELSPWAYNNCVWGIRPISTHLWVIPDFCAFRGLLVLGADNASPTHGSNTLCGEPQSGLWLGKTDDLWRFGKPAGWGGPWWEQPLRAGEPSDPYLMTGFEHKCLHLAHDAPAAVPFSVEVDFLGHGAWKPYAELSVPAVGYVHHEFPTGFSAHWLRLTARSNCVATAQLFYT